MCVLLFSFFSFLVALFFDCAFLVAIDCYCVAFLFACAVVWFARFFLCVFLFPRFKVSRIKPPLVNITIVFVKQ